MSKKRPVMQQNLILCCTLLVLASLLVPSVFAGPLHEWVKAEDLQKIEALLDRGAAIDERTARGMTPLHLAVSQHVVRLENQKNMIQLLLKRGAPINDQNNCTGETPLHIAVRNGNIHFAKLLLDYGADVNARIEAKIHFCQKQPTSYAVSLIPPWLSPQQRARLFSPGSREKLRNGTTPLHDAVFRGHRDVVKLLLSSGADVNAKDNSHRTPLHLASDLSVGRGRTDMIKLFRQQSTQE